MTRLHAQGWGDPRRLLLVVAAAWLLKYVGDFVAFPLWMRWNPGRALGYWLLETPFRAIAAPVRHFSIYMPDCILLAVAAAVIPILCRRRWFFVAVLFTGATLAAQHSVFRRLWLSLIESHTSSAMFFCIVLTAYVLSVIVPAWLSARFLVRPRDPMRCRRCGYSLRGLPENRCPECGTAFEAG